MGNGLIWLCGIVILVSMTVAYARARDPLHPLMYFGPMLLYIYVFTPLVIAFRTDSLSTFFRDPSRLEMAQAYVLAAILCFCLGCLRPRVPRAAMGLIRKPLRLTPPLRRRLLIASYVLAAVGIASFLYMTSLRGGIIATYSMAKGRGWAPSGYITSAPLLTIPAIMLLFVARQGEKSRWGTWLLATFYAAPHILHASFGARRGAAFLLLATVGFSWYLSTGQRPSWRTIIAGVGAAGLVMIFLASQRSQIYIGSDFEFDKEAFKKSLMPTEAGGGDLVIYSWGMILMADDTGQHGWGRRYLVHALIRPIPKQVWPTKYEDAHRFFYGEEASPGAWEDKWMDSVGWLPPAGSATGFVADSFLEFSWGGVLLCYVLGFFHGATWKNAVLLKGFWTVLYLEAAAVSVFLVTQGVASSWLYRMAYLAVPSYLVWRALVRQKSGRPILFVKRPEGATELAVPHEQDGPVR